MRIAWLAMVAFVMACVGAHAHDVPTDVRVHMYVKPEGRELLVLVRVPLAAMRDVDVPTKAGGFLDLARADAALREAAQLWLGDNLAVREGTRELGPGRLLETRISLAADASFRSWDSARANLRGPRVDPGALLYWNQQFLDALIAWPIESEGSAFAIHPRFARMGLRVATTLRYLPPGRAERAFELHGDPGWVTLDPSWTQAFGRFVLEGFNHILDGTDHLLFIACLVIPFRRLKALVLIATAFTLAHSITLAMAATGNAPGGLWFPPLVELLIAVSIAWLALENIFGANVSRRWIVAFAFGLVHGFGFAFGLKESLQFAGDHLAVALVAFNLGVELGQVAVLVVLVPLLDLVFRRVPERLGIVVLSAIVGHTAWHWMGERWDVLKKFPVPAFEAAAVVPWTMAAIVIAAAAYFTARILRARERR